MGDLVGDNLWGATIFGGRRLCMGKSPSRPYAVIFDGKASLTFLTTPDVP